MMNSKWANMELERFINEEEINKKISEENLEIIKNRIFMCYDYIYNQFEESEYDPLMRSLLITLLKSCNLTVLDDVKEDWCFMCETDGNTFYYHARRSSIVKKIDIDGSVTFQDVDRFRIIDIITGKSYRNQKLENGILSQLFPITFPYQVPSKKTHFFSYGDYKKGIYAIRKVMLPNGNVEDLELYLKEDEQTGKIIELTKEQFEFELPIVNIDSISE